MVEIVIIENVTNVKTNDINVFIDGDFELKKEGARAPEIKVIANNQQELEQLQEATKNV